MYEDSDKRDLISMGVSVLVTNLIIVSYTIMAFAEPKTTRRRKAKVMTMKTVSIRIFMGPYINLFLLNLPSHLFDKKLKQSDRLF